MLRPKDLSRLNHIGLSCRSLAILKHGSVLKMCASRLSNRALWACLCIFSTGGFGDGIDSMGAAGEAPHYAKALHATMWSYRDGHLERVLLAAARQMGFLWINDYSSSNAVSLDTSCFHQNLRQLTIKQRNKITATADVGDDLPKAFPTHWLPVSVAAFHSSAVTITKSCACVGSRCQEACCSVLFLLRAPGSTSSS